MKINYVKSILFILLFSLLTSCTRIETLKRIELKGSNFQNELSIQYRELAEEKAKKYEWIISQHFIKKSLLSAYGKQTKPEVLKNWSIPKDSLPELTKAREHLVDLLTDLTTTNAIPKVVAKAQVSFDCMVVDAKKTWSTSEMEKCKKEFQTSLAEVKTYKEKRNKQTTKTHKSKPTKPSLLTYKIPFKYNVAKIGPKADKEIKTIIKKVKSLKHYEIVLNSYTKKAGNEDYNLKLSKKRALAVKKKLTSAGIPAKKITLYAFGSSKGDGIIEPVKDPKEKRIEITISD